MKWEECISSDGEEREKKKKKKEGCWEGGSQRKKLKRKFKKEKIHELEQSCGGGGVSIVTSVFR